MIGLGKSPTLLNVDNLGEDFNQNAIEKVISNG